ncbi:MAG: AAA family ATPase [Nitrososphaeraceae archaeon]|nr:AAA family ATPase [Nitrososphaeraceae archaeon]
MKKLRFVITGNPGVGKHTTAKIIAEKINADIIDINDVAIDNNATGKKTDLGLDVDVKRLVRLLEKQLKAERDLVIVGHLAPYVLRPVGISLVAVLRRSPYELEKTLKKRGYSVDKVRENVASEILGTSLYDSLKTFGKRKVAEFDTTGKTPKETADEILAALQKKPKSKSKLIGIDWLNLVSEKGDMRRFFKY